MERALWTLGLAATLDVSDTVPMAFGPKAGQPPSFDARKIAGRRSWGMRSFLRPVLGALVAIAFVVSALGAANAQSLSLVTSQAALQSNDNVSWAQLGSSNGVTLPESFNATSANQNPITVNLNGANSILAVSCPASSCSWAGSGMASGDTLVWTSDGNNGGNGPITVNFGHPQGGVGAFIQADGPSVFTAQI